ncbi:MAG TPA: RT0821/Lpp0805 family surface protein [Burkholderiaceae bacterium]|nr:RT0821/Lpp0805 family surface protein [Burkholderiaceae bacterium]
MIGPSRNALVPVHRLAGVALLALACAPAMAQNWIGLLKDTPAERFDDEDIKLFLDASRKALTEAKAGEGVGWQNPASGSRGELKVLKTFDWQTNPCRQLRVTSETVDRKGSTVLNLCNVQGKWKVLSPSQVKKG